MDKTPHVHKIGCTVYRYTYLPTLPTEQDVTQGQFLKWDLTGLNSEFSFSKTGCQNKVE